MVDNQNNKTKQRVFITIPNLKVAGAQKMVEQLVGNFNYSNFEVRLAIQSAPLGTYLEESVSRYGAQVIYFNKKSGFHIRPFIQAWRDLNTFQPDVIHTHVQSWVYILPWVLCHKVKVLHTIHSRPNRQENKLMRFVVKYFYYISKFIPVAISNEIAAEAVAVYGLSPGKIETIYNPVSYKLYNEIERIPHSTFNFVMVARYTAIKNHLFLIDVFSEVCKKCKNVNLLLAGDGELMERVKNRVNELEIQDSVEFVGVVNDIPTLLARSDAFVLPSLSEGMPMTLLEAEAAGLPVVASNVGGIPDVVKENGFLVPVNDAKKFKEYMIRLAENPELCLRMGSVAKTIAKQYDVSKITHQYEGLYEKYAKRN